MTDELIKKCRGDHCFGKPCGHCQFIKEEKSMTKKEEIQQEIEKTQKQLAALQEKLKEAEDEVPEELDFSECSGWYVGPYGETIRDKFSPKISDTDRLMIKNHRAFKSEEYAKTFAKKTQFIADILHFKYLYDRDHKPDWNSEDEGKYGIYYDIYTKQFTGYCSAAFIHTESVYFSTRELANHCAKWLNKKYGYTKE